MRTSFSGSLDVLKPQAQPVHNQPIPNLLRRCHTGQVFQKQSRWVHGWKGRGRIHGRKPSQVNCMDIFLFTMGSYSLMLICFGIVLPVNAHQELTLRVYKKVFLIHYGFLFSDADLFLG